MVKLHLMPIQNILFRAAQILCCPDCVVTENTTFIWIKEERYLYVCLWFVGGGGCGQGE